MVLRRLSWVYGCWLLVACTSNTASKNEHPEKELEPMGTEEARTTFILNCASCHGQDGKLGASGAKDLSKSTASDAFILNTISNGNDKGMMPYNQLLSKREIDGLIKFVKTLRTSK